MSVQFEEDGPDYRLSGLAGDERRFWRNKPLAQRWADRGFELFGGVVYATAAQFVPDRGFVAVLFTETPLPSGSQEGYEVVQRLAPVVTPTPPDWHTPKARTSARPAGGTGTPGGTGAGEGGKPASGATARVWAIADREGATGRADRSRIVAVCVAEGINPATAATQWSKYAKSKGW